LNRGFERVILGLEINKWDAHKKRCEEKKANSPILVENRADALFL